MSETTESKVTQAEAEATTYYLLNVQGYRVAVSRTPNVEGATVVGAPVEAESYAQAKVLLQDRAKELQEQIDAARVVPPAPTDADLLHPIPPSILKQEPLFKSVHDALAFAFQYCGQQSPKTPMSVMLQRASGPLGSGKGLSGLDGAGQAGLVLAALRHMNSEQRHVIIARYGDVRAACPCCGQPAPDAAWLEAVEALSQCDALRDLPKQVRHAAIENVVGRRKLRFQDYATEYGLSPRTLRHKLKGVKDRYAVAENQAVAFLTDYFDARGLLIKG